MRVITRPPAIAGVRRVCDHRTLFRIYSDLVRAKDSDDFEGMGVLLYDLKYASQTHLMVENVRFYVYLQQQYSIDRDTSAFIAELRNCWTARQRMTRIFCDPNLVLLCHK